MIKGNIIYVTTKDIKNARLGTAAATQFEGALLAAGYVLSVETSDAKNTK